MASPAEHRVIDEPRVLFSDDDLIVIDKPSGMPSVPARSPHEPPDVAARLRASGLIAGDDFVEAVHRLDRDTSGVLVLARSHEARRALGRAFEARAVTKRYLAVVQGLPAVHGEIDLPLGDDPVLPPRQRIDPIFGRRATTRWLRLAIATETDDGRAFLALEPLTGRSHQLRAHLAWLGTPIVGDRLYGPPATASEGPLALHAATLVVPHPRDGRPLRLDADLPHGVVWTRFRGITGPAWEPAPTG